MVQINDVMEAVSTAIHLEQSGHAFYLKAAAQTSSPMGAKLFESLAADELVHLETFRQIFSEKLGKEQVNAVINSGKKYESLPIFPMDLKAIEGANPDTNELDALHMAMDSEKEAIDLYTAIMDFSEDEEFKSIMNEIIKQERSHYILLEEEFNHLSHTGYWYELDVLGG